MIDDHLTDTNSTRTGFKVESWRTRVYTLLRSRAPWITYHLR